MDQERQLHASFGIPLTITQRFPRVYAASHLEINLRSKHSRLNEFFLILGGFLLEFWLYILALQLFYPESINWPFATWLPIRLDYVGEAAFNFSFFIATVAILWNTKRNFHPRLRQPRHP